MGKTELMQYVEDLVERKEFPEFKAGDTITVHYKIKEGNKERIQNFQGVVLQRSGSGSTETFTVRKITNGVGVERIFPICSPFIEQIDVNKRGAVRRAARSSSKSMSTNVVPSAEPEFSISAILPVRKPVLKRRDASTLLQRYTWNIGRYLHRSYRPDCYIEVQDFLISNDIKK